MASYGGYGIVHALRLGGGRIEFDRSIDLFAR